MSVTLHPRVLELISSRICHDLVSPVGAISNGVELIEELGETAGGEALSLIASSAEQASVRLKCFRIAYGAAGTDKNMGFKSIIDTFSEWINVGNVNVEFEENLALKFSMPPKGFLKVLLNILILATECSRGEGNIKVTALDDNNGVQVSVTGSNVSFRDGAEEALSGDVKPEILDARTVHSYVTGRFAECFDIKLDYSLSSNLTDLEIKLEF